MLRSPSLRAKLFATLALSALAAASGGCQLIAGLGGEESLGKGGTGGATSSGGSTTTTNGGGGTGGTAPTCTPGDSQPCYSGPDGTKDTGLCKGGTLMCSEDGMWSACEGEIVPQLESCAVADDEDCNGLDCVVWLKTFPGDVNGDAVAIDAQGNVFAALQFSAGTDFGDGDGVVPVGGNDVAVLKYDKAGKLLAKRVFPAGGLQSIGAIAVDKNGNVTIGGNSDSQIDFGFGKLDPGPFVARLDSMGTPVWATSGSGDAAHIDHIAVDSKGNVFAGGSAITVDFGTGLQSSGDPFNFWIARFDGATGGVQWCELTKGMGSQSLAGLAIDPSDSLVLTGSFSSQWLDLAPTGDAYNCCGQSAPFLARLDADGNMSDGKQLAGGMNTTISAYAEGLAVDKLGASIIAGSFSGPIDLKGGMFDAGTYTGIWLVHDQTTGFNQVAKAYFMDGASGYPAGAGLDSKNNVVMYGNYSGPYDLGGGALPPGKGKFVAKVDKDGNFLWQRAFYLGDGNIKGMAVGTLEDETVLVGNYYGAADLGTGAPISGKGMFLLKLGK